MNTVEQMKQEINTAITNGEELDDIRDNVGEWADGYVPVYNDRIIREWQEMPSEYDNRGYAELGAAGEINILQLMALDLYLYYTDLFNEALDEVESELADKEEN